MKTITRIEMADDSNAYAVGFGKELSIKQDGDGFSIFEGDEELNYYHTEQQASKAIRESIVDDSLIIKGFGKHSGRKFWQLPEDLKNEILRMAQQA